MTVVRLDLAYDGTGFRGWARQPGQRTIQGALEEALGRVLGQEPKLSVAGRTDAGVHASGQVASFRGPSEDIDLDRVWRSLNTMLGPELVVRRVRTTPEGFDARHSATGREYVYRIDTGPVPDPFTARFVWHRPGALSLAAMRAAARHLVGEHDFAAFCRTPQSGGTVRHLRRLTVSRDGERLEIRADANAFLHQMVRSLVGTLVWVGDGRIDPDTMPSILEARDRSRAGQLAPPHGLTLARATYGRRSR
jgi:tRNA pseudouridine38-40 synthase